MLLLLNDHLFKGSELLPAALTGKLSDVAGLVVAPVLLAVLFGATSRNQLAACCAFVAAPFIAINTSASAARTFEQLLGALGVAFRVWCDATDLLALPALGLAWWLLTRTDRVRQTTPRARAKRGARRSGLTVHDLWGAMLRASACLATSAFPAPRPAVADGKIVAQIWGAYPFHVIDSSTGEHLTMLDADGWASITDEDGGLLYSVRDRQVIGLSVATGERVLEYEDPDGAFQPHLQLDEDHLYLLGRPGVGRERLVALDRRRGEVAWAAGLPSSNAWRPLSQMPLVASGQLVVPVDNALLAFSAAAGRRLWRYDAGAPLHWLTSSGPQLFAADEDGVIHAIDAHSGRLRWKLATDSPESFEEGRWWGAPRLSARAGLVLYVHDDHLTAHDSITGAARWRGPAVTEVVYGETLAVAELGEGKLAVIELRDGRVRWRLALDEWLRSAPLVAEREGIVVVRPQAEVLYAFELADGRLRWTVDLSAGTVPFPEEARPE